MKQVELAVVINSYNRLDLLKRSMNSLLIELNKTPLNYSVIVFDAGSTDGSREWLEQTAQDSVTSMHLLKPEFNEDASFSYGVNKACSYAIDHYTALKYILLYETDNFLHSCLPILLSKKILEEKNHIAACGYTVMKHDGTYAGFGSTLPSFLSFLLGQQLSFFLKLNVSKINWIKKDEYAYSYADVVYTSPILIRKDAWQNVNGFDADNFPFSDCDIDLAYRLKQAGWKMAVLDTQEVVHDNLEIKSSWSSTRTLSFYRARLVYFIKHYGSIVYFAKPLLLLMHLGELVLLSFMVLAGKRSVGSLTIRGLLIKSVFENYQTKKTRE